MSLKAFLSICFARFVVKKNNVWKHNALKHQQTIMHQIVAKAQKTAFGLDHSFSEITCYSDFKKNIPIRDYEEIKTYIDRVVNGEKDVLWPRKPIYFCKTSGTTSGSKFIPITKESMPFHLNAAIVAILTYIFETKNSSIVNGKMIFLQGSPVLTKPAPY